MKIYNYFSNNREPREVHIGDSVAGGYHEFTITDKDMPEITENYDAFEIWMRQTVMPHMFYRKP